MNIDDWAKCQFCGISYPVEEGRRCECPEGDISDRDVEDSPSVAGQTLPCSLAEFEHRCRVQLGHEQSKLNPDTALVALLCDAVRLSREYGSVAFRAPEAG
jgi:hypothetical protein